MPLGDIIGGARSTGSDDQPNDPLSRPINDASETIRAYLNDRTPDGVVWKLNFPFIIAVLSGIGALTSLYDVLR